MAGTHREAPTSRFLFADTDDFLTPVGQAINEDFLADEETLVVHQCLGLRHRGRPLQEVGEAHLDTGALGG